MITSKQRAFLRSLANKVNSTFQIGKDGVGENQISQILSALEKHEIVKIHVLENSLSDAKDVCREVASLTNAEEVQVIGHRFVIYKESQENKRIDLKNLRVKEEEKKSAGHTPVKGTKALKLRKDRDERIAKAKKAEIKQKRYGRK